jgi:Domain of unknown function (DUF4351)
MPEERPNGDRALILRLLTRRIGELTPDMQQKIQSLSLAQIEALGEELLDFTGVDDLVGWLSEN